MSPLEVHSYHRPTYFSDGPDPMCRSMWSCLYSSSSTAGFLETVIFNGDVGTFEAKFVCDRERDWRGCDKVVNVRIARAWDT